MSESDTGQTPVPGALVSSYREQIWPGPGMEERVGAHLERQYGGKVTATSALDASVYAIDWGDGRRWIARLFPPARSLSAAEGDAEILRFLASEGFPAERCADVQAVSVMEDRAVLVTERREGTNGRQSRGVRLFRSLGELLGRLQTMPAGSGALGRPAGSWHHLSFNGGGRQQDQAELSRLLVDAKALAPAADQPFYDLLRDRLAKLDGCADLPQALIHPDFSTPNVIVADSGPVLIDWTGAGRGARLLSLGTLLSCTGGDLKLVGAILEGYSAHIRLEAEEIARLPDAVRGFGLIVDCWSAVFRPKSLKRIVEGRVAKWYTANRIAKRAQEQLRARS